jgi:hypothetical protein
LTSPFIRSYCRESAEQNQTTEQPAQYFRAGMIAKDALNVWSGLLSPIDPLTGNSMDFNLIITFFARLLFRVLFNRVNLNAMVWVLKVLVQLFSTSVGQPLPDMTKRKKN